MVGRFVHNQKIGRREQHLSQRNARFLASGQHADFFMNVISAKTKHAQNIPQTGQMSGRRGGSHFIDYCIIQIQRLYLVLGIIAHMHPFADIYLPLLRCDLTENQLGKRGFTGAVFTHQRHFLTTVQME